MREKLSSKHTHTHTNVVSSYLRNLTDDETDVYLTKQTMFRYLKCLTAQWMTWIVWNEANCVVVITEVWQRCYCVHMPTQIEAFHNTKSIWECTWRHQCPLSSSVSVASMTQTTQIFRSVIFLDKREYPSTCRFINLTRLMLWEVAGLWFHEFIYCYITVSELFKGLYKSSISE